MFRSLSLAHTLFRACSARGRRNASTITHTRSTLWRRDAALAERFNAADRVLATAFTQADPRARRSPTPRRWPSWSSQVRGAELPARIRLAVDRKSVV